MGKASWIKVSGVWKQAVKVWRNHYGTWEEWVVPYVKVSGVWKPCFELPAFYSVIAYAYHAGAATHISGTIKLRNSSGTVIAEQVISKTDENPVSVQFDDIESAKNYYVDFGSLVTWIDASQQTSSYEWSSDDITYNSGSSTNQFTLNSNISRYGRLTPV